MIRHKRNIGEGDARFRHIDKLFIETTEGERYMLQFNSLTGGRAMLEHVRQGGRPYDIRGNHITNMVVELAVLSRFKRANHGQIFEGDTAQLVEQAQQYQTALQRNLKNLSGSSGYARYFESWDPAEITEEEVVIEGLKNLFVKQTLDTRIESALPLLARIQQGTAMKEANIFENWANGLMEGTWQLPDTPKKQNDLIALMQQELSVGADATNAIELLYDLVGDDELFDQLHALADLDANADARQTIIDRLQELSSWPEVRQVLDQIQIDPEAEMNPPESTPADLDSADSEDPDHVPSAPGTTERLAEQPNDPHEPAYPEYDDSLSQILKIAGVPAAERPAPNYETGVDESDNDSSTGILPLAAAGGLGYAAGSGALDGIGSALTGLFAEEETDEGVRGALVGGALGGAATRSVKGAMAGAKLGSAIQDRFAKKPTDETIDPTNPRDYEIPAVQRKQAGQAPLTAKDVEQKDRKAQFDFYQRAHGRPHPDSVADESRSPLAGQYGHSGKMKAVDKDTSFLDRLKELSGMKK